MPKKLAVTIAGAVSLGSYEAGVLWEVLDAIRQHNQNPKTSDADKIIIDVITGASAGGMTAVILAQKLLYCAGEFKAPSDNPLYNTWVKGISLKLLQQTQPDESALQSIFSSDLIEKISRDTVMGRYELDSQPAERHPAVGDEIRIGLALTNLNGLAYTYPVRPQGEFAYIDYSDQMTRHIVAAEWDSKESWEQLRQAAVACGAFPIAFRTQDIERSRTKENDDYDSPNLKWDQSDTRTFTYSDGGILQNQPLGLAKNLVDPIDEHLNQNERFYLFVSPHEKDPQPAVFSSKEANYFEVVKRLIGVGVGQAGFHDWITAEGVNESVRLLDERAIQLKDTLLSRKLDIASLQKVADQLLDLFFDDKHVQPGARQVEPLEKARKRIAHQYRTEIHELAELPGGSDAFRDAILAFETAAGLGARDLMTIYGVTAKENELAGAGLQSFLGFFDEDFREHDYNVGRDHARKILKRAALSGKSQIGPIQFEPCDPSPKIDPQFDGPQLHKLKQPDRDIFKHGMQRRVDQMIATKGPLWQAADLAANPLVGWIVSGLTKPSDAVGSETLERGATSAGQ